MKWRNTRIYSLKLSLLKPIPVKGKMLLTREVLRIERDSWDGRRAWAECSPLPGFHQETLTECLDAAKDYFTMSGLLSQELPVSLKTATELLEWQLELSEASLRNGNIGRSGTGEFENSALLTVPEIHDFDCTLQSLEPARVCKVKVAAEDLRTSRIFLESLVASRRDRELRIDCNQALEGSSESEVKALLADLPIASIEEPFADLERLKTFARSYPLALDESLGADPELDALAKVWVIKPNRLGWIKTLERFSDAGPQDKILSNCFESLETLQTYAWAYHSLVKRPVACGFGTAFYMADKALDEGWDPKVYRSAWPLAPIADCGQRGELVWEH